MERRSSSEEPEMRLFDSSEELSSGLIDYLLQVSETAVKERGSFSLVLSGGDLPQRLGKLTRVPFVQTVEWSKWYVFWAEENVVPKRHPDCFYKQARDAFLSKVPIHPAHVISVSQGLAGESAAEQYEFAIRQHVRNRTVPVSPSSDCPRFDLVLLTLGSDGHVASLYPGHAALEEETQWVTSVVSSGNSSNPQRECVTLTLPVINAAANVAIVASGVDLARQFSAAMGDHTMAASGTQIPARKVSPRDGKLVWFVDSGAASLFLRWKGRSSGGASSSSGS